MKVRRPTVVNRPPEIGMAARQAHPLRLTQEGEHRGTEAGPEDQTKEDVAMALLLERDGRTSLRPIDEASYVHGTTSLRAHLPREIWHAGSAGAVPPNAVEETDSVPEWWDTFACEPEEVLARWPVLHIRIQIHSFALAWLSMHSAVESDMKKGTPCTPCSLVPSPLSSEFFRWLWIIWAGERRGLRNADSGRKRMRVFHMPRFSERR